MVGMVGLPIGNTRAGEATRHPHHRRVLPRPGPRRGGPPHRRVPGALPAFSAKTTDYVSRCRKDRPLLLAVHAPDSAQTTIGRRRPTTGSTAARLHLAAGQATTISIA